MENIQESESSSMFHTKYSKLERRFKHDDDCEMGGCPGHIMVFEIESTSGTAKITSDGNPPIYFGCNEARALLEMLYFLEKDGREEL